MIINRRKTVAVKVGDLTIGGDADISVQSMCATRTSDVDATVRQIELLRSHGADIIRVAVDTPRDIEALKEIRRQTSARLVIDLQENYRAAAQIAPYVQKIRYNPGHLHHLEKNVAVKEKVRFLVNLAKEHALAVRIGINFGSLDPALKASGSDQAEVALASAREHVGYMREFDFQNFVVSLKSARPKDVMLVNRRFAAEFPEIPIHLGVTEAGLLPMGEVKSRQAFEPLLAEGIGDTLRVSLTLPFEAKFQEIVVGRKIVSDVYAGKFSAQGANISGLNIVSCPSCSRVENEAFVKLAEDVRALTTFAANESITIAVMGCRVNGPGETDEADLGLWCAPKHVNLKRKGELVGAFPYTEVLDRLKIELESLISDRKNGELAISDKQ